MIKKLFLSCLAAACVAALLAQPVTVGSYNIRYRNVEDSIKGNAWGRRCPVICQLIQWEQPEIIGLQEVLHSQLLDLRKGLSGYEYIGVGRDDGMTRGEYAPIFYRTDEWKLDTCGHFWLSQTPERPSIGWDAACVRICTWGLFERKTTQQRLLFMNLHMDHVGKTARREAAHLVVKRYKQMLLQYKNDNDRDIPVVLTGDFNVDQNDEIYEIFTADMQDCYECSKSRFATNGTFHGFHPHRFTRSRIDHIFVTPDIKVDAYCIRTDSYWAEEPENGFARHLPSDHYPVLARIVIQ